MNVPNFFSILRIVSIPLFIILLSYDQNMAALGVFLFAAATDALDGFFARCFKQKTTLGAYLDPIADKLLLTSSFVAFALLHLIPKWLSILVVSRDVIISMGILILRLNTFPIEIRPSILSKFTTVFQLIAIGIALLVNILEKDFFAVHFVYWLCGFLTIASGMHYIFRGLKIVNERDNRTGGGL
ncbi:MAG: CDP-diacylglycerol--glycerol-3-phosphate 3-phosphatidyltransferase [Pseudomonadota bacterium]